MSKRTVSAFVSVLTAAAMLGGAAAFAQTQTPAQTQVVVYPAPPPDHYLPSPAAMQQSPASYSPTVYSPSDYPTAQGHYLQLPQGYQQQAVPRPAPVAQQAAPAPAATYRSAAATISGGNPVPTVAPVIPAPVSVVPSPVSIQPHPAPVAYYPQQAPAAPSLPTATYTPATYNNAVSATPYYGASVNPAPAPAPQPAPPVRYNPQTPVAVPAPSSVIDLGTGTGISIGAQISDYHYGQSGYFSSGSNTKINGPTYGITLNGTKEFHEGFFRNWFAESDFRLSYGLHKYKANADFDINNTDVPVPLSSSGFDDYMFEGRLLAGHDFLFRNTLPDSFLGPTDIDVSPYAGLGFRFLLDDGSGSDILFTYNSTIYAYKPYVTYSHYIYLPFGATERIRLNDHSRLSLNNEFDVLIGGWETDAYGNGNGDFKYPENEGIGLRGSLMYEWNDFSFGPFGEYWNIRHSGGTNCFSDGGETVCYDFAHTNTTEAGLQLKYKFGL